jgi:hypothetical protein
MQEAVTDDIAQEASVSTLVKRDDYQAPAFWIDSVELGFDLDAAKTRVLNKMRVRRNGDIEASALRLDGEDLTTCAGQRAGLQFQKRRQPART